MSNFKTILIHTSFFLRKNIRYVDFFKENYRCIIKNWFFRFFFTLTKNIVITLIQNKIMNNLNVVIYPKIKSSNIQKFKYCTRPQFKLKKKRNNSSVCQSSIKYACKSIRSQFKNSYARLHGNRSSESSNFSSTT